MTLFLFILGIAIIAVLAIIGHELHKICPACLRGKLDSDYNRYRYTVHHKCRNCGHTFETMRRE